MYKIFRHCFNHFFFHRCCTPGASISQVLHSRLVFHKRCTPGASIPQVLHSRLVFSVQSQVNTSIMWCTMCWEPRHGDYSWPRLQRNPQMWSANHSIDLLWHRDIQTRQSMIRPFGTRPRGSGCHDCRQSRHHQHHWYRYHWDNL